MHQCIHFGWSFMCRSFVRSFFHFSPLSPSLAHSPPGCRFCSQSTTCCEFFELWFIWNHKRSVFCSAHSQNCDWNVSRTLGVFAFFPECFCACECECDRVNVLLLLLSTVIRMNERTGHKKPLCAYTKRLWHDEVVFVAFLFFYSTKYEWNRWNPCRTKQFVATNQFIIKVTTNISAHHETSRENDIKMYQSEWDMETTKIEEKKIVKNEVRRRVKFGTTIKMSQQNRNQCHDGAHIYIPPCTRLQRYKVDKIWMIENKANWIDSERCALCALCQHNSHNAQAQAEKESINAILQRTRWYLMIAISFGILCMNFVTLQGVF